jgi:diguanylate cyclase (GGDEF)-like protein/PAS domain S-box-containing protein
MRQNYAAPGGELRAAGICVSAAALETLQQFVSGLRFSPDLAYLITAHVPAGQLCPGDPRVEVSEAADGAAIQGGYVYVPPAGFELSLEDGRWLRLSPDGGSMLHRVLLESAAPAAVLVDEHMTVLESHGGLERFLNGEVRPGSPLTSAMPKSSHGRLRSQLWQAIRTRQSQTRWIGPVKVTVAPAVEGGTYAISFQQEPAEARAALDAVLSLNTAVAILDASGKLVDYNDAWMEFAAETAGLEAAACVSRAYPSAWGDEIAQGIAAVQEGHAPSFTCDHPCPGRLPRWFHCSVTPASAQGTSGVVVMHFEITEHVLGASAMDAVAHGVFITDREGQILWVNGAFTCITGYQPGEVVGRPARNLLAGRYDLAQWENLWAHVREGRPWRGETVRQHRDGHLITLQQTGSPLAGPDGALSRVAFTLEDITARKRAEWQVLHLARHDALTGLPNRTMFYERTRQAVEWAERRSRRAAVILLDLDQFKDVNDTMGHAAGDSLLVAVARRLESRLNSLETLVRLGGDEFALLAEDVESRDQLAVRASTLLSAFSEAFSVDSAAVNITASMGVAVYPEDGHSVEELLRGADLAMYKAKRCARSSYCFFDAETGREASDRVRLVRDLRAAFLDGSLHVAFQPQVELASGRLIGAEALIRWRHAGLGDVNPAHLIHIAEASGLIRTLGDWVLNRVCGHIAEWSEAGWGVVPVAVNLSPMQLAGCDVAERVLEPVTRYGLTPAHIGVEITESVLLEHSESVHRALHELSNAGVALVLDDFGTGYSSLTHLRHYPVNTIKVDLSFVHGVGSNTGDEQIITAILGLARALGIHVVAEGVETAAQAEFLRARGCDAAQGYYFGRPMGASEFAAELRARNRVAKAAGA